jgi:hypothetical protein
VPIELVAGPNLPITLVARPASDADGATFETPGGVRPKVRMDLTRDEAGVRFRLVVEFATSQKPATCGPGAFGLRTTGQTTSFHLDPVPFSVIRSQEWKCLAGDSVLRVPKP